MEVTSEVIATLVALSARAHPQECCGLLTGRAGRIDAAIPAANVAEDPLHRFEIDPAALIAAHRAVREGGAQLLGYFHSHPIGTSAPSPTDREHASGDGRIWAIVAGGSVAFWRDGRQGFEALSWKRVDG